MKRLFPLILMLSILCIPQSCHKDVRIPNDLVEANDTMDRNPKGTLQTLNRLEAEKYHDAPENIQMKLALLKVKARDKAFIVPSSDSIIKDVVAYYDKHGTTNERMEAYYYLGNTYRDLHDSPRTVECYLTAIDLADTTATHFDWELYHVLCTQLAGLYARQYDYAKAIGIQKRIVQMVQKHKGDSLYAIATLGMFYNNADSIKQADYCYNKTLSIIKRAGMTQRDIMFIGMFLGHYIRMQDEDKIRQCLAMIRRFPPAKWDVNVCSTVGSYYESIGQKDSALYYLTYADQRYGTDIYRRQSSLKHLYLLHHKMGNKDEALRYAQLYMLYTDSIEADRSKGQTSQAENMYRYYQNAQEQLKKEQQIRKKMTTSAWVLGILLIFASLACTYAFRKRREAQNKTRENQDLQKEKDDLRIEKEAIATRYNEEWLQRTKQAVEMSEIVQRLKQMNDIGEPIKDEETWNELFATIDNQYPGFREELHQCYGKLDLKYLQFLYLLKAGFNKSSAAQLMNKKRNNASYWCKYLDQQGNGRSVNNITGAHD